jgi:hypothetical protein
MMYPLLLIVGRGIVEVDNGMDKWGKDKWVDGSNDID